MRKIIFFSFIGIVAVNAISFYAAYRLTQVEIQKGVEETATINEAKPESGSLFQMARKDFDSLSWTRRGKEFKFNGRVFDVSRIIICDSSVQLFVDENKNATAEAGKTVPSISVRQS